MAKKRRMKKLVPRNPVARDMLTSGLCKKRVVEDKKKRYNRSELKAQDRKILGCFYT